MSLIFNEDSLCLDLAFRFRKMNSSLSDGNYKEYKQYFKDVIFDLRELSDYVKDKRKREGATTIYRYFDFVIRPIIREDDLNFMQDFNKELGQYRKFFLDFISLRATNLIDIQKIHNRLEVNHNVNKRTKIRYDITDNEQDDLEQLVEKIQTSNRRNFILHMQKYLLHLRSVLRVASKIRDLKKK